MLRRIRKFSVIVKQHRRDADLGLAMQVNPDMSLSSCVPLPKFWGVEQSGRGGPFDPRHSRVQALSVD